MVFAALLVSSCGRVPILSPHPATSPDVAFWGDSLTEGFPHPPFQADGSDSLPGQFQKHYAGGRVYNGGVSGETAAEIAIRQGGLPLRLVVQGGVIPRSGSIAVRAHDTLGWRLDRQWTGTGTLAGVPGIVSRSGGQLTFTRSTPGQAQRLPAERTFVSAPGFTYRESVQVLFAGSNDIGYASPAGDPVPRVVAATTAMANYVSTNKRILICGTTTATADSSGTAGYNEVVAINTALAAQFPAQYWDLRGWLVHHAIHELGITPTAEDLSNMEVDTLPPSIMVPGDPLHFSPATAAVLADAIHAQLSSRGWIG